MAGRRSALGRGLGALLPPSAAPVPPSTPPQGDSAEVANADSAAAAGALIELPIDGVSANPDQPRRNFDAEELEQLAASLRRHGLLQPVVVRRAAKGYELLVGERRWRAARRAGLRSIPALLAEVATPQRLEMALVENIQRRDLNAVELALAFRSLSASGMTHDEIGQRVGMDRSSVSNYLRILELSPELLQDIEAGRLQLGHAKALLSQEDPTRRHALRDRVVRERWSVRQTEVAARATPPRRASPRRREKTQRPEVGELVAQLRSYLKTQVRIAQAGGRGSISIAFAGDQELHRIAELILGKEKDF